MSGQSAGFRAPGAQKQLCNGRSVTWSYALTQQANEHSVNYRGEGKRQQARWGVTQGEGAPFIQLYGEKTKMWIKD